MLQYKVKNLEDVLPGIKTSIVTLLERALVLINDDNTRNDASACNMLGAFMERIDANERGCRLTAGQVDSLRTQAEDIRDVLGC
jgi:hypothetical protein